MGVAFIASIVNFLMVLWVAFLNPLNIKDSNTWWANTMMEISDASTNGRWYRYSMIFHQHVPSKKSSRVHPAYSNDQPSPTIRVAKPKSINFNRSCAGEAKTQFSSLRRAPKAMQPKDFTKWVDSCWFMGQKWITWGKTSNIKYDLELPGMFEDQASHVSMSSLDQESGNLTYLWPRNLISRCTMPMLWM